MVEAWYNTEEDLIIINNTINNKYYSRLEIYVEHRLHNVSELWPAPEGAVTLANL